MYMHLRGPRRVVPDITYPFKYFEKYPISLKMNWQISPKVHPNSESFVSPYPQNILNFHKSILYPFQYLANIPISLKTLPGASFILRILA